MGAIISLQFSSVNDFGSELIRAFDHGKFSHVDVILADGELLGARNDVYKDIPAGVQKRPPAYANFSSTKRVDLDTTPPCADRFYKFLDSQIGKPYDGEAILGFAVNRDWRDPAAFFCSELVAAGLEDAGYFAYSLAAPSNKITPADLLLALSAVAPV